MNPGSGRSLGGGNSNSVVLPGGSHGQRGLVGYSLQGCKESDTTKHARTLMKDSHPVVVLWGGSRRNEEISLSFLPLISCQRSPLAKPTRSQRARNILMWSTQDSHWVHRAGWRGKEKITDTRSIPSPALFTCRAQMFPQHRVGI